MQDIELPLTARGVAFVESLGRVGGLFATSSFLRCHNGTAPVNEVVNGSFLMLKWEIHGEKDGVIGPSRLTEAEGTVLSGFPLGMILPILPDLLYLQT